MAKKTWQVAYKADLRSIFGWAHKEGRAYVYADGTLFLGNEVHRFDSVDDAKAYAEATLTLTAGDPNG